MSLSSTSKCAEARRARASSAFSAPYASAPKNDRIVVSASRTSSSSSTARMRKPFKQRPRAASASPKVPIERPPHPLLHPPLHLPALISPQVRIKSDTRVPVIHPRRGSAQQHLEERGSDGNWDGEPDRGADSVVEVADRR